MVVWWNQLEGHAVLLDGVLEFRRALVVEDMPLGFNSCCFEVVYQVLVGMNHFTGCAICFNHNCTAVEFNQHHHILVVDIGLVEKPFQHTCLYHLQDCVVNGDYLAI